MFEFKIVSIESRWFDVQISNDSKVIEITNSPYLNNDAPKILLRNLNELFYIDDTRWLCWHDEPGAYIWKFTKIGDQIQYEISSAFDGSFEIFCKEGTDHFGNYEGTALQNEEIVETEIAGEASFLDMFKTIVGSFHEYSNGEMLGIYEKYWGDFPHAEYTKALSLLSEIQDE